MMVRKWCSKSLAIKIIVHLSQINRKLLLLFNSLVWNPHFELRASVEQYWIEKLNHIFSNLEGGLGVLPRKILKTNKAGGHLWSFS